MFQNWLRLDLILAGRLGKCHPGGTSFEGLKGSFRAAEAWHCERSGEAISEGANSEQLKNHE